MNSKMKFALWLAVAALAGLAYGKRIPGAASIASKLPGSSV